MNLREQILTKVDVQEETITIPEWDNAEVLIVGMVAAQWSRVRKTSKDDGILANVLTVIESALDPNTRQPIFQAADRDALMGKNMFVIDRLASRIIVLSGLTEEAKAALEKNSGSLPTPGSSTN